MHSEFNTKISIIIPVHNEEENISPLASRLINVIQPLTQYEFEILFVDDGSQDHTIAEIEKLIKNKLPVGYIQLSRNFGHQAALEAGLTIAKGDAIISLDGDIQHPPEEIPSMIKSFEEGADVVQMQRVNILNSSKGMLSQVFHFFFKMVSKGSVVPNSADFRLISRKVRDQILLISGKGKLFRSLIPSLGYKQIVLPYKQEKRNLGTPSYSLFKLYELALNIVFKSSKLPAHVTIGTGFIGLFIGLFSYLLIETGVVHETMDRFIIATLLVLIGCIFLASGVICWYLIFILEQVQKDPSFIIYKVVLPNLKS